MTKEQVSQAITMILSGLMPSYPQDYWIDNPELLGAVPEFDSMTIVNFIGELEEQLDVMLDDDDVTADNFATLETVVELVSQSL